jgi:hypothetical protein
VVFGDSFKLTCCDTGFLFYVSVFVPSFLFFFFVFVPPFLFCLSVFVPSFLFLSFLCLFLPLFACQSVSAGFIKLIKVKQKIFTEQKRGKENIEKGKERKRGNKNTERGERN